MAGKYPEWVPESMAYMIHIIKASQEYEGLAWFMYDKAHRRQAATGFTEWSKINPSIFSVLQFKSKIRDQMLAEDIRGNGPGPHIEDNGGSIRGATPKLK